MRSSRTALTNITNTRVVVAATAAALLISACGSSTTSSNDAAGTAGSTPAAESTPPVSDAPAETVTDGASEAGATEEGNASSGTDAPSPTYEINEALAAGQFIPASSFDLPCVEYFDATEYPLTPCDKGPLVEEFQTTLSPFADVTVDGFYGEETIDAVEEVQRSFGLYQTGVADSVLLGLIVPGAPGAPAGDEPIVDSGLTASEIEDLCNAAIASDAPDLDDFTNQICERFGYFPVDDELIVDSGLTEREIIELCDAAITSDAPDLDEFTFELCERNGYLPTSGE